MDGRLLRLAPSVRRSAAALAALIAVATAGTVAFAAGVAGLLAQIVGARAWPHPLALLLGGAVGRTLATTARDLVATRAGARAEAEVRRALLAGVGRQGARAVQARQAALATLAGVRLGSVSESVGQVLPTTVAATVVPLVLGALVLALDLWSAAVLAVTLPVVLAFLALVGLLTRDRTRAQWERLAALSARFLDLVRGLPSLRVYGRAEEQTEQVRRDAEAYRRGSLSVLRTAFLSGFVLDVGAALSVALVAVGVGLRMDAGHLAPRTGILVLLLVPELFAPVRALGATYHQKVAGDSAVGEVLAALDAAGTHVPAPLLDDADGLAGVTFRVDGSRTPVLDDVSLVVRPGEVIALTGRSGAGKSTVLALLLGQVAPEHGAVLAAADGPRICWVPQDPRPSAVTVGEELRLAAPSASAVAVTSALAECAAPGASTPLGEDGMQLSAGERRRVALAAALLRARVLRQAGIAPLVLLDEPTEGLDDGTAVAVRGVLQRLRGTAGVVVVTHDANLAEVCDRVVELRDGRAHLLPVAPHACVGTAAAVPAPAVRQAAAGAPAAARDDGLVAWALRHTGRRRLALAAGASAAAAASGVGLTATSVWLVCRAAQQPGVQALALAVVGVRAFALSRALLRYAERLAGHDLALDVLARVRALVFARLVPQAPAGFGRWRRGDLLRRFTSDTDAIQDLLVRVGQPVMSAFAAAAVALAVVALASPHALAVAALGQLVAVPVALMVGVAGSRWTGATMRAAADRDRIAVAAVESHAVLTAHAAWDRMLFGLAEAERAVARNSLRQSVNGALVTAVCAAGSVVSLLAVVGTNAHHVAGAAAAGALLAAAEAAGGIATASAWLGRVRESLGRVDDVLGPDVPTPAGTQAPLPRPVTMVTDELVLRWPDGPLLTVGSSVSVAPGARLAVTGPSGTGKSTLLAGLSGLITPAAGQVAIVTDDGVADLADLTPAARSRIVSGSLDGDHVFDADVRANITLGRPATDVEVLTALRAAGLREWTLEQPRALGAPVGADGSRLSGGQRQRLLLARALLRPPSVLLLDEPTAHLDPATEADVTAGIVDALRGRTAVVVTHRSAVVDACTAALRFDHGCAVRTDRAPARDIR